MRIPNPTSPTLPPFLVAVWELLPLPWNSYFLSLLSPVLLSPDYLLSLRGWETFHITSQTILTKRVGDGATPSFFSNQVSK